MVYGAESPTIPYKGRVTGPANDTGMRISMGWFLLCLPHCAVGGAFRPASLYFRQIVGELLLHSLPESGSLPRPFLNVNSRRRLSRLRAAEAIFLRVEPSLDINKGGPRKGERNCTVRRTRPLEQPLHPSGGLSLADSRSSSEITFAPKRPHSAFSLVRLIESNGKGSRRNGPSPGSILDTLLNLKRGIDTFSDNDLGLLALSRQTAYLLHNANNPRIYFLEV